MEDPVDLQEYLDSLPFPAFVLDYNNYTPHANQPVPTPEEIKPVIVNQATRDGKLGRIVVKEIKENPDFRKWLCFTRPDGTSVRGQEFFLTAALEFSFNFLRSTHDTLLVRTEKG